VRNISSAEVIITRAQSLLSKFRQDAHDTGQLSTADVHSFVSDLLEQPEVNVIGAARAPLGVIIHRLFVSSHKVSVSCQLHHIHTYCYTHMSIGRVWIYRLLFVYVFVFVCVFVCVCTVMVVAWRSGSVVGLDQRS